MKKIALMLSAAACIACSGLVSESDDSILAGNGEGMVTVTVQQAPSATKAQTDYTTVLPDEMNVRKVAVFVFDKTTGTLNASKEIATTGEKCTFTVTAGEKTIYAVANGPDLSSVTTLSQLGQAVDDLSQSDIGTHGLMMTGSCDCTVEAGGTASPIISVRRMVARVVLQKVTCSLPSQYGSMTLDCIYLGNANTVQTLAGAVSGKVNPDGYADAQKTKPIGKNGVTGSCPNYLFYNSGYNISVGSSKTTKYHFYCQPGDDSSVTCMYLLATIGGNQYYYRVPLNVGLNANMTCSVELEITNLGAPLPPDGDLQKGEISATINVAGWDAGNKYEVEF